jgi:uncharacterized protein (TIGR02646 family)
VRHRSPIPECPQSLAVAGAEELERAEAHFSAEDRDRKKKFEFGAYDSRAVRSTLRSTFHEGCAYCEERLSAIEIEHYRPKGAVRTENGRLDDGYWWLAASWENLLPACYYCNTIRWKETVDGQWVKSGKGEWFPLEDESARATAMGQEEHEKPLLLNPYNDVPSEHLNFLSNGEVKPRTRRGEETIRILDLNRGGLRDRRWAHLTLLERTREDLELAEAEWLADKNNPELAAKRRFAEQQVARVMKNGYFGATAQHLRLDES